MHICTPAMPAGLAGEGNAGNSLQGFAVGLAMAELQLRLPDVYKGGLRGEGTASRLRLPQHAGGPLEVGHPQ